MARALCRRAGTMPARLGFGPPETRPGELTIVYRTSSLQLGLTHIHELSTRLPAQSSDLNVVDHHASDRLAVRVHGEVTTSAWFRLRAEKASRKFGRQLIRPEIDANARSNCGFILVILIQPRRPTCGVRAVNSINLLVHR